MLFLCLENILTNHEVTLVEFCNSSTTEDFATTLSLNHRTDKALKVNSINATATHKKSIEHLRS